MTQLPQLWAQTHLRHHLPENMHRWNLIGRTLQPLRHMFHSYLPTRERNGSIKRNNLIGSQSNHRALFVCDNEQYLKSMLSTMNNQFCEYMEKKGMSGTTSNGFVSYCRPLIHKNGIITITFWDRYLIDDLSWKCGPGSVTFFLPSAPWS